MLVCRQPRSFSSPTRRLPATSPITPHGISAANFSHLSIHLSLSGSCLGQLRMVRASFSASTYKCVYVKQCGCELSCSSCNNMQSLNCCRMPSSQTQETKVLGSTIAGCWEKVCMNEPVIPGMYNTKHADWTRTYMCTFVCLVPCDLPHV